MSRCHLWLQRSRNAGLLGITILFAGYPVISRRLSAQQPAAAALAFTGVTVVDVAAGRLLPEQTVVIVGNRVQAVGGDGKVPLPKNGRVVDSRGKYLIPGLWDMHVHIEGAPPKLNYSLLVANGVTGVRQTSEVEPWEWRRSIAAGEEAGPRVVAGTDIEAETAEESHFKIDEAKAAGADFVKVHDADVMKREVYFAIAAYARKVGIPLIGHLPNTITEVEASDSGQRTMEHFNELHCWWPDGERMLKRSRQPSSYPSPDSAGVERCAEVARTFARNGTWFVPTLTVTNMITPKAPEHPKYWPQSGREGLEAMANVNCCPSDPTPERGREIISLLHRFGIPLLAGTDAAPILPIMHGFSLHDELGHLVEGGLSPLEALRAATLNPAKYLQATDSLGIVAPGKLADLVLLDADPLTDIGNTKKIRAVVANGRYFDRAALDALLAEAEALAAES